MGKLTLNKHFDSATACINGFDSIYMKSEVIVCNNIEDPGIYIFTDGVSGSKKINVMDMSVIKLKANPSTAKTGTIVSGDTLEDIVTKLQNQINAASGITSGATTKISNIVVGVGLNPDGTYKAIAGKYVGTATTVAEAITALSNAIEAEKADAIAQGKTYTDTKVKEEIEKLDADIKAPYGTVFTAITEVDGKISADTQMLHVEVDAAVTTSNHYNFYLSSATASYKWGEIDVPKDQFLKDVSFIASATTGDVAIAAGRGCLIYEGHAYLVFNFTTSSGDKWVYTDMTTLVGGLTAKDIKISSAYTKTSYNIKANTPLEDAVDYITTELDNLNTKTSANTISSTGKTITVTTAATGTNVDVYIDNASIVTNENMSASEVGRLSTFIDIKREMDITGTATTKMKYTLLKSGGTPYGKGESTTGSTNIIIPRDFIKPKTDELWLKTTTTPRTGTESYVDETEIQIVSQDDLNACLGETEALGNGLATAWGIKQFVKTGVDGDGVAVGDNYPLPKTYSTAYWGDVIDDGSSPSYDNVHEAVVKQNNNFHRFATSIGGLKYTPIGTYCAHTESVADVYQYDKVSNISYKYISSATSIMGAIRDLDTTIEDMDFLKDTTSSVHYMTGITQVDGKITEIREAKLPDATVNDDDQGVKVTVEQTDGKLTGLTVEVTTLDTDAAITSTANDVVSGKGVRAALNSLPVVWGTASKNSVKTLSGNCIASGNYSFAEGSGTTASGFYSHAEGSGTKAISQGSHAEGSGTTAEGIASHAEGVGTKATNTASHSEGSGTTAGGLYSHAEGSGTSANSVASHAEGIGTITTGPGEHACGKYNVSNTNLIFSVGIGTGDTARMNGIEITIGGSIYGETILTAATAVTAVSTAGKIVDAIAVKNLVASASDFSEFSSPAGQSPDTKITVGSTSRTCKVNADTVDGYHFVVGSTGTTANTIYFL